MYQGKNIKPALLNISTLSVRRSQPRLLFAIDVGHSILCELTCLGVKALSRARTARSWFEWSTSIAH